MLVDHESVDVIGQYEEHDHELRSYLFQGVCEQGI